MSVVCTYCDNKNPDGANYCNLCGEALTGTRRLKISWAEIRAAQGDIASESPDEIQVSETDAEVAVPDTDEEISTTLVSVLDGPFLCSPIVLNANNPVKIGRDRINDIVVPMLIVSRYHAEIVGSGEPGRFCLKDLGSRNGISVNGIEVKEHVLEDEDIIGIGICELLFKSDVLANQTNKRLGPREFHATLDHVSMHELIELVSSNHLTGNLNIVSQTNTEYTLYVVDGRIINARGPEVQDRVAAIEGMSLKGGRVRFIRSPVQCSVTIQETPSQLIREVLGRS